MDEELTDEEISALVQEVECDDVTKTITYVPERLLKAMNIPTDRGDAVYQDELRALIEIGIEENRRRRLGGEL